jgi:hypothetical protein
MAKPTKNELHDWARDKYPSREDTGKRMQELERLMKLYEYET